MAACQAIPHESGNLAGVGGWQKRLYFCTWDHHDPQVQISIATLPGRSSVDCLHYFMLNHSDNLDSRTCSLPRKVAVKPRQAHKQFPSTASNLVAYG